MTTANKQSEIARKLRGAMTVAELIEALGDQDPEALVLFTCDYGDYHHTTQALLVREVVDAEQEGQILETSAYSHSGLAVEYKDDGDYEDEEDAAGDATQQKIVILTSERQ